MEKDDITMLSKILGQPAVPVKVDDIKNKFFKRAWMDSAGALYLVDALGTVLKLEVQSEEKKQ